MTASARVVGADLGRADLQNLRLLQEMTERHLRLALSKASGSIAAAADPNQFIDDTMIEEFIALSWDLWDNGAGILISMIPDFITDPTTLIGATVQRAVADSVGSYTDILNKLIGDKAFKTLREPIYGEFYKGELVQYGDVRPLLVGLGGGSPDPQVEMMGGVTTGKISKDWLGQNGVQLTNQKIWLYGYEDEPRRTFNGHLQMDGLVFTDWNDEALKVAPQDYWLRSLTYFVGDHQGCSCLVAPYVPNFGSEYQIDA